MTYEEAKQFAEENGKYLQPLLFSLPKVVVDIVSLSWEKKKKGGKMEALYYNHFKKLSFLVCFIFGFLKHFTKF